MRQWGFENRTFTHNRVVCFRAARLFVFRQNSTFDNFGFFGLCSLYFSVRYQTTGSSCWHQCSQLLIASWALLKLWCFGCRCRRRAERLQLTAEMFSCVGEQWSHYCTDLFLLLGEPDVWMICSVFLIVRARVQQVLITVLVLRSGRAGKIRTVEHLSPRYSLAEDIFHVIDLMQQGSNRTFIEHFAS